MRSSTAEWGYDHASTQSGISINFIIDAIFFYKKSILCLDEDGAILYLSLWQILLRYLISRNYFLVLDCIINPRVIPDINVSAKGNALKVQ